MPLAARLSGDAQVMLENHAADPVPMAILFGTICFFLLLFLLMIRFVPFMPIAEQKELLHQMHDDAARQRKGAADAVGAAG